MGLGCLQVVQGGAGVFTGSTGWGWGVTGSTGWGWGVTGSTGWGWGVYR